jgi:hypothetical protein
VPAERFITTVEAFFQPPGPVVMRTSPSTWNSSVSSPATQNFTRRAEERVKESPTK